MKTFLSILVSVFLSLPRMFCFFAAGGPGEHIRNDEKYPNVFVGGLLAYGEQSGFWYLMPTFGIYEDVPRMLEQEGYECYVTSPGSLNSNWDRACNVYAELTGTRADYGEAHAREHGHARYGEAFAKPLLEDWGPERPINLFGHSQGGQTIYQFAHLLAEGSAQEREATTDGSLSPLFEGGKSGLVHSVSTLGGILNGTSAEPTFIGDWFYQILTVGFLIGGTRAFQYTGLCDASNYIETGDHAMYELTPGGAAKWNHGVNTQPDVYYFSHTLCDATLEESTGNYRMDRRIIKDFPPGPMLYLLGKWMGRGDVRYYGQTFDYPGGPVTVDERWRPNDGAANVFASKYPFGSPHKEYDAANVERGVWQSLPTMQGYTHGFYAGFDFTYSVADLKAFYMDAFAVIDGTY